jgi:hypothetical protein
LRLDQIEDELLDALVASGDQQIAVAPETGSATACAASSTRT